MRDTSLLQLALGLVPPWAVIRSEFDAEARQLDIHIDFAAGSRFACPCCGAADCSCIRHRADESAASRLLPGTRISVTPVCRVCIAPAAGSRRSACPGARPDKRLHLAVRGVGHEPGLSDAGQRRGPSGRRT